MVYRYLTCAIALGGLLLVGCSSHPGPIVDTKGVNMASYDADLTECREYSDQVAVGEKAAKGAASGAVVGGAIGAIVGNSSNAARGAGVGAVTGGAKGVSRGEQDKVKVVKNCLRGRGYRVLN